MITKHSDPFLILQKENHTTAVYPFYTDLPVIQGSVVVLHGMAEHHERYYPFADFLNRNGFDVYLYDHRGHGVDKSAEQLGFFAEKNGDRLVVSDAIQVLKHVKAQGRKLGDYYKFVKSNKGFAREFFSKKYTMDSAIAFINA